MNGSEISALYHKLEDEDPEGGYVSRSSIFRNALAAGKITEDVV